MLPPYSRPQEGKERKWASGGLPVRVCYPHSTVTPLSGFCWGEGNPKVTAGYVNHSWEAAGSAKTGGGWESILSLEEKKEENGSWGTMISL